MSSCRERKDIFTWQLGAPADSCRGLFGYVRE